MAMETWFMDESDAHPRLPHHLNPNYIKIPATSVISSFCLLEFTTCRFTLDTSNYIKLMRLFMGEPVWTAYNRPQEEHPARKEYIESFTKKVGLALEAH